MTAIISNIEPLQPEYVPSQFNYREDEKTTLEHTLGKKGSRNIHVQGRRGTGKTHLLHTVLHRLPDEVNTCYVDCRACQTQYQALKQILRCITQEPVSDGLHTSDLQRKIEERTGAVPTIIVLDEVDFLLKNQGDDLLYYLSRTTNQIQTVTVSNQTTSLKESLEERTYSSLQPRSVQLEPYNGEETYQILLQRAQNSLKPQTLQQSALTYISSTTQNLKYGLSWLKTAATKSGDSVITEDTVQQSQKRAYNRYAEQLLDYFTEHHKHTFQAIQELSEEQESVQAGDVYTRYQELCQAYEEDSLSNRRISDHLKQLEHLDLIQAEYHYGGRKGKTREIQLGSE
jgi:orc1/cdc6 family replication initiation protein